MSAQRVRELYEARPFQTFKLGGAGFPTGWVGAGLPTGLCEACSYGRCRCPAAGRETGSTTGAIAFFPGGRSVVVTSRDTLEIIDLFLVAAVRWRTHPRAAATGMGSGGGRRAENGSRVGCQRPHRLSLSSCS